MSVVNILNIQVLDNPTKFANPFQFEITFECISPLKDGKIILK
jgi:histone chaperone ASF1